MNHIISSPSSSFRAWAVATAWRVSHLSGLLQRGVGITLTEVHAQSPRLWFSSDAIASSSGIKRERIVVVLAAPAPPIVNTVASCMTKPLFFSLARQTQDGGPRTVRTDTKGRGTFSHTGRGKSSQVAPTPGVPGYVSSFSRAQRRGIPSAHAGTAARHSLVTPRRGYPVTPGYPGSPLLSLSGAVGPWPSQGTRRGDARDACGCGGLVGSR